MEAPCRRDKAGRLRVVSTSLGFVEIVEAAFSPIRQFARQSVPVALRLLEAIATIAESAHRPNDRAALKRQALLIAAGAETQPESVDRDQARARLQAVLRVLWTASSEAPR